MYVYMCTYTYTYMYICICIYKSTRCLYIFVDMHIYTLKTSTISEVRVTKCCHQQARVVQEVVTSTSLQVILYAEPRTAATHRRPVLRITRVCGAGFAV